MPVPARRRLVAAACLLAFPAAGLRSAAARAEEPAAPASPSRPADAGENSAARAGWKPLFDGKTLAGWKESDFAGGGPVKVEDAALVLGTGLDLTGVTATAAVPKVDYEVRLDAKRVEGSDFFCGLTFPVGEKYCSLIVGGWGGGVVGLSSLNGMDASENETTTYKKFESGRWYPVRLRVTSQRITAWIDGEEIVDQDIRDRALSTRIEVGASKPFGIASWQTTAALRGIEVRALTADEAKAANAELPDDE